MIICDSVGLYTESGQQIIDALENGVSKYPSLEGRFPQVSGISFGFDPTKPPGQRIDRRLVRIQGSCLKLDKVAFHFTVFLTVIYTYMSTLICWPQFVFRKYGGFG